MRNILIGIGVIAALIGGFFVLNNYIYQEKQGDAPERRALSGVVTAVDLEPLTYDGPAWLSIRTDAGEEKVIEIPARMNLCEGAANITDASLITVGDRVEVTGDVNPESQAIVPCGSPEHYLHAIATFTDEELGIQFNYRRGPDGYILQTAPHGNEEANDFEVVYLLALRKDLEMFANSGAMEGPPMIAVAIFDNPERLDPGAWVERNAEISNIRLATGEAIETTVGGANAVRYAVDGLYRIDTLVIAHGGFIYAVTGAYLEEESAIRRDFEPLLNSIVFIERPGEE